MVASGNVAFETDEPQKPKGQIEAAITGQFGFPVAVVLRSEVALRTMLESNPFAASGGDGEAKRYVVLLDTSTPFPEMLEGVAGDFDIVGRTEREIFVLAHKLPNGRYGQGMDKLGRMLDKAALATTRNWNTILKAACPA